MKKITILLLMMTLILALTTSACGGGGGGVKGNGGTTGSPSVAPYVQATLRAADATATHATGELYIQLTAIAEQERVGISNP